MYSQKEENLTTRPFEFWVLRRSCFAPSFAGNEDVDEISVTAVGARVVARDVSFPYNIKETFHDISISIL